jgi:hypothetical protein
MTSDEIKVDELSFNYVITGNRHEAAVGFRELFDIAIPIKLRK